MIRRARRLAPAAALAVAIAAGPLVAGLFGVGGAAAQGLPIPGFGNTGTALPVAIEADQGVEWRQNDQVYIARGNATAKRGDTTVRADTLTAHYRRSGDNRQEIYKIVAEGAVKITTPKDTIDSDTAEYMVETGVFTLKGRPAKLDNGKGVLTAGLVVYDTKARVANVTGGATVVEDKKSVRADRFIAYFKEDAGKQALKRVEAFGNVVNTTPTEIAKGDRGDYDAETQVATLIGNVRLTRGDNQLNGDRAEVNMKSGVSRLLAEAGTPASGSVTPGRRVRVLIVPGQSPDSGKGPLDIPIPGADNKGTGRTEPKR
ncbi:MAG: LptA/OstA family protein [Alphaproteobacteria bacterium]